MKKESSDNIVFSFIYLGGVLVFFLCYGLVRAFFKGIRDYIAKTVINTALSL